MCRYSSHSQPAEILFQGSASLFKIESKVQAIKMLGDQLLQSKIADNDSLWGLKV